MLIFLRKIFSFKMSFLLTFFQTNSVLWLVIFFPCNFFSCNFNVRFHFFVSWSLSTADFFLFWANLPSTPSRFYVLFLRIYFSLTFFLELNFNVCKIKILMFFLHFFLGYLKFSFSDTILFFLVVSFDIF